MTTYAEIQAKIAELQKEAEEIKERELESVFNQIKNLMDQYGITISDLTQKLGNQKRKIAKITPKYRDPVSGKEWTGRGVTPKWISQSGKDKESFLIRK